VRYLSVCAVDLRDRLGIKRSSQSRQVPAILAPTCQDASEDGLLLVTIHQPSRLNVSPSLRSSPWSSFTRSLSGDTDGSLAAPLSHSLCLQPDLAASNHEVSLATSASASSTRALLQDVSIERQFSRISPTFPRSLARCFSRAQRRCAALLFRLSQNLFDTSPHRARTKRFSEPSEKAPLDLGSGAPSRRFAQECPEGNPGKYRTGEMT
jgi:hypothetical protein